MTLYFVTPIPQLIQFAFLQTRQVVIIDPLHILISLLICSSCWCHKCKELVSVRCPRFYNIQVIASYSPSYVPKLHIFTLLNDLSWKTNCPSLAFLGLSSINSKNPFFHSRAMKTWLSVISGGYVACFVAQCYVSPYLPC